MFAPLLSLKKKVDSLILGKKMLLQRHCEQNWCNIESNIPIHWLRSSIELPNIRMKRLVQTFNLWTCEINVWYQLNIHMYEICSSFMPVYVKLIEVQIFIKTLIIIFELHRWRNEQYDSSNTAKKMDLLYYECTLNNLKTMMFWHVESCQLLMIFLWFKI